MSSYRRVCQTITGRDRYVESDDPDYEPSGIFCTRDEECVKKHKTSTGRKCQKRWAAGGEDGRNAKRRKQRFNAKDCATDKSRQRNAGTAGSPKVQNGKQSAFRPASSPCRKNAVAMQDEETERGSWAYLPVEVLSKIFMYTVIAEGSALPCLSNLKKVCRQWNNAAKLPYLWTSISFTPVVIKNEKSFKARMNSESFRECASHHFQHVRMLSCSGLERVTAALIKTISEYSKAIYSVSIVEGGTLTMTNCLDSLVGRHGKTLRQFSMRQTPLPSGVWRKFLKGLSESMEELEIVCCRTSIFTSNIRSYPSFNHLENLSVLKLDGNGCFFMKSLMELKKLKTLHVKGMSFNLDGSFSAEWPALEDVDFSCKYSDVHTSCYNPQIPENDLLLGFFCTCYKLKRLCLRFRFVSLHALHSNLRYCNEIVHLDVAVADPGDSSSLTVGSLVSCIGPSLKELYIDGYKSLDESLVKGMEHLSAWRELTILSIQSTNIKLTTLQTYLDKSWKTLAMLDVSSCRDLPRGYKRNWTDISRLRVVMRSEIKV